MARTGRFILLAALAYAMWSIYLLQEWTALLIILALVVAPVSILWYVIRWLIPKEDGQ